MKKVRLLVMMILSLTVLVACGANESVGVCEETIEDMNRLRMEFYAKNEKVYGYKIMFGFNQAIFQGASEDAIEKTIESELGLAESPTNEIEVGFDHIDGYSFVSVHFKDLNKIDDEHFATMGINNSIEPGKSLEELMNPEASEDGIKCWVE